MEGHRGDYLCMEILSHWESTSYCKLGRWLVKQVEQVTYFKFSEPSKYD